MGERNRDYAIEAVRAVDSFGRTPLHVAAQNGRTEIVRFLLEQASADVHATLRHTFLRHGQGETPLVCASHHAHIEVAQLLLAHGAASHPDQEDKPGEADMKGGGGKHEKKGIRSGRVVSSEEAMTPLHVCPEPKQCGADPASGALVADMDAGDDDDSALAYIHFLFRHRVAQPCRRLRCVQCKRKIRLAADGLRDEDLDLLPDALRVQQSERRAANAKTEQKQSAREAILRRWEEQDATAALKHRGCTGDHSVGLDDGEDEEVEDDFEALMAKMKIEMAEKAAAAAAATHP
jgi:hypothetical protein